MTAPSGRVNLKDPAYREPGPFHNGAYFLLQPLDLHRFKLEKKRLNDIGRYIHDENTEEEKKTPDPEPPPCRARLNNGKGCDHCNKSHRRGDRDRLHQIDEPEADGHGIESIPVL